MHRLDLASSPSPLAPPPYGRPTADARWSVSTVEPPHPFLQHQAGEEDLAGRLMLECQRKNVFMATLAHELRNTMEPLGSALEILSCGRADPQLAARTAAMAQRQLQHMNHLLNDLLDVGRVVNDKMELQLRRSSLQELVSSAAQASANAAAQRRQTVALDMPEAPLWVDADPVRFGQILTNLLNNALKFTPPGGHIRVAAALDGDCVELSVADDGVGIASEDLDGVFDMFAQAHRSKKHSAGGLGIGLSVVRRLVELHGGTVTAHSRGKNMGSTFTVTLPLAQERLS